MSEDVGMDGLAEPEILPPQEILARFEEINIAGA